MTWADYKVPVTMIPTGEGEGKTRPVRGLSLEDISTLIVDHLDDMMEITTLYIQSQKDVLAVTNYTDMLVMMSKSFPRFVSEVISIVTDTPEFRDKRIPAGLQLAILTAAAKLTVEDAGGMGNLTAMLQNAVRAAVANRGEVSRKLQESLSPSSIGGAAKTRTSS